MSKDKDTIFGHPKWQPVDRDGHPLEPGALHDGAGTNDPNGRPAQWTTRAMAPSAPGYSGPLTLKDHMQYELLNAADIAFILKHRPGSMPPGQYLNQSTIGGVGMGVDRMQKLCGFEWLQLYIYYKFMRDNNVVLDSGNHMTQYLVGGGRPTHFPPDTSGANTNVFPGKAADDGAYAGELPDAANDKDFWAVGGYDEPLQPVRIGTLVGVYHSADRKPSYGVRAADVGPLLVNDMTFQEWIAANFQPPAQRFLTTGAGGNFGGAPFFSESALMLGEDDWFAANDLIHRVLWHQLMLSDIVAAAVDGVDKFGPAGIALMHAARRAVYPVNGGADGVKLGFLEMIGEVPTAVSQSSGINAVVDLRDSIVLAKADASPDIALFNILSGSFSSLCATIDPVAMACFPSPLFATSGWSYVEDHRLEEQLERAGLFDWCPDGVVINKLNGGDSPFVEGFVQADMGQLYNIAVQGSAVCKSFKALAYDMQHKTSPRDNMFVTLSVVSECNLLLVGANAGKGTEDAYALGLGQSFVAEMVNVMVAGRLDDVPGTDPMYAHQIVGEYAGRSVKAQKLGLSGALPGRYDLYARKDEFYTSLRGVRAKGGGEAKGPAHVLMRKSAGCVDDGANLGTTDNTETDAIKAAANQGSAVLAGLIDSGLHKGSMLQCDQPWRFPADTSTDPTKRQRPAAIDVISDPTTASDYAHHVGAVSHKALSALVMVGPQTKARLDRAMASDLACISMFGCARRILLDNKPVEAITLTDFGTAAYAGVKLVTLVAGKADNDDELQRARVQVHNAREAYAAARAIVIDLEAEIEPQGVKTRRSALHHRVRAVRAALVDFMATVRRLLPHLDFQVQEDTNVNGGELVFVSENNRTAVDTARKATFGVNESGLPDPQAGGNYSTVAYYRAGCVNSALWQYDITDGVKDADERRELIMGWYRVLILAGLAVPSDCKLCDARMELMGSQQMSQHDCQVTDHLQHGYFERKPAFKRFEGTKGDNFFGKGLFRQRMIVGAWKIGSVIDSAASPIVNQMPSDYMHQSAMHPANVFADNLNVAIEWWPGSKLANAFGRKALSRSQGFKAKDKMPPRPTTSFAVSMEESAYRVPKPFKV